MTLYSPLALLLLSAAILVTQAGCVVWWSSRSNRGQKAVVQQWVSIALIAVQLAVFAFTAFTVGVSAVSEGTGMDNLTHAQIVLVAAVCVSAVGWMFFGHCAHKLSK